VVGGGTKAGGSIPVRAAVATPWDREWLRGPARSCLPSRERSSWDKREADVRQSHSNRHGERPSIGGESDLEAKPGREARRPVLAVAGIACLSIIALGTWVTVLFSNGLTREYGVDPNTVGLGDLLGAAVLSLPALGLALLGVRWLRRSGSVTASAWACLLAATVIIFVAVVGTVMAVLEFGDTEGAGRVLASRASAGFVVAIATYLIFAGVSFLRDSREGMGR